jgi:hypothetical protein
MARSAGKGFLRVSLAGALARRARVLIWEKWKGLSGFIDCLTVVPLVDDNRIGKTRRTNL